MDALSRRGRVVIEWTSHWAAQFGAGAEHLRDWVARGSPPADRSKLCIMGDAQIVSIAKNVMGMLPDAIADYLVRNALVVCGGVSTRGQCHPRIRPPCALPVPIGIYRASEQIAMHEVVHGWQVDPLPEVSMEAHEIGALRAGILRDADADVVLANELETMRLSFELAADELAGLFLGYPVDTGAIRDARQRQHLLANLAMRFGTEPSP